MASPPIHRSLVSVLLAVTGCGPISEINRPDPVDISKFFVGEKRIAIVGELGMPTASIPDGGNSCDMYQLYTRGPGAVTKGVLAFGEAAADVFTLGLSEVLFTPVEGATSSARHTVLMCYAADDRLVSVRESGTTVK
jgi:hypothetical protein